jgi:hypothetical protein
MYVFIYVCTYQQHREGHGTKLPSAKASFHDHSLLVLHVCDDNDDDENEVGAGRV